MPFFFLLTSGHLINLVPKSADKDEVEARVRSMEQTAKYVNGLSIIKVIVVPGKIVNIVVK